MFFSRLVLPPHLRRHKQGKDLIPGMVSLVVATSNRAWRFALRFLPTSGDIVYNLSPAESEVGLEPGTGNT